jgi:uncharacterized protein (TIRG00374 family)
MKRKLLGFLKPLISISLIAIVASKIDFSILQAQFKYFTPSFVLISLGFYTLLQILSCFRWQLVLNSCNHQVSLLQLLGSYFAGMFLNIFLPGALGGDAYRIYRTTQSTQDPEVSIVSVFLERFTGLAALSGLALISLPPAFKLIGRWDIVVLVIACSAALLVALILISSRKILKFVEPFFQKLKLSSLLCRLTKIQLLVRGFAGNRNALFLAILLSTILQLGIVYYHLLIAKQLNIPVTYLQLLVFIPIVVVVTLLPISLGGLGLKEGLWVYLFSRVGLTAEHALMLSLSITVLSWLLSFPGALILLFDSSGYRRSIQKATE